MEYFSTQSQWQLPQSSSVSEQLSTANGSVAADDWPKHLNSSPDAGPSSSNPNSSYTSADPTLDLPDSSLHFSDLPIAHSNSPAPQPLYWPYPATPGYYYTQFPPYQLPVTSYSSLNGATAPTHSSEPSLDIDPTLTSGSSAEDVLTVSGGHLPALSNYGYQQQPVLAINPSALHSSTTPISPHQTSNPIRTIPKADLRDVLKHYLTPANLSGSSAVGIIVRLLGQYGVQDIAPDIRSELFSKLSVQADDQFFKSWVENTTAMDITRSWLKAGIADSETGQLRATINPILGALGRMRFSIASLKDAKLGKIILKLTKDSNSATRDLSLALEKKWRTLVSDADVGASPATAGSIQVDGDSDENKGKKRKIGEVAKPVVTPPSKKLALASTPLVKPVKKEPKVVVTSVKDAKSDSSFFSKPKAVTVKPKLPSFKKSNSSGPTSSLMGQNMKEQDNVAQPSSVDPFKDALMTLKRNASPKVESRSTPPRSQSLKLHSKTGKALSIKKRVTFAPDGQLEQIKFIERAVYDDDTEDTYRGTHNLRDLDRGEGAAMHAHLFEEQVDWVDPLLVDIVAPSIQKGSNSSEKFIQEEREKGALSAIYVTATQIPESPAEPSQSVTDDPDSDVKYMMLGKEMDLLVEAQEPEPSIPDLMAKIQSTLPLSSEVLPQQGNSVNIPNFDLTSIANLAQNLTFEQLLSQVGFQGQLHWPPSQHPTISSTTQGESTSFGFEEVTGRHWEESDEGWNGRGRGRGRGRGQSRGRGKSRPCAFFAQGRCRYGDQCDFSHDPAP